MNTIETEVQKIHDAAQTADPEVRILRRIEVGRAIHQGDVYVHRVPDDYPRGKSWGSKQVAIGDTQGSRHVAEGDVEVFETDRLPDTMSKIPRWDADAYRGPVVVAKAPWRLTHPEHAHHQLPAGTYQVTYQMDARTRERVMD